MKKLFTYRNARGFTLVEIIVVIAIVAVLSATATVSIMAITKNAEKKAAKTYLSTTWNIASNYLDQLNSGFGGNTIPSKNNFNARFGDARVKQIGTSDMPSSCDLSDKNYNTSHVYIQYKKDTTSNQRYTLQKIYYWYKGVTYFTTNGTTLQIKS